MNVRALAASVVNQVASGHSLSDSLAKALLRVNDARDRALLQAICYGVCRYYMRLDYVVSLLIDKPMKEKDSDVHALLLVGLYQLMEMRVPPHAAVAETVNASGTLKKAWARGFTNAILRAYLRRAEPLGKAILADNEARFAHPSWWIDSLKQAWPDHWESILLANNAHPPFALRVNLAHLTREQYLARLTEAGLEAVSMPDVPSGILMSSPVPVETLPQFAAGDVSVLDACSAPGGKLTHLLTLQPQLAACVAVEKDMRRMASIQENLDRLTLTKVTLICEDAGNPLAWWDGQPFDRILLDAPCSASGVIRRHPDIKLLREACDLKAFAVEQLRLLTALWPTLKQGGRLLYVTCSVFPQENEEVVQRFLMAHPDAIEQPVTLPNPSSWGLPCRVGLQILPGMGGMDGFYYARLMKQIV